ncbi:M16 family metallopeptidase [Calditrichota bacterium LG25]
MRIKLKFFALLLISVQLLTAQNNNVVIHQLDNGLQVLLIQNPALPMVGVNVAVKVGSAYETFATSGMSHMLEHLLFNGTTSRTQKQLYDDVDRIGAYNNANTGQYYTNYMMVVPAENIKQALELQSDMLFHSILPEDKFEKEKGIVLEEISKTFADPDAQLERNLNDILYEGHALSLPTLGTYATIKGLVRDQVFEFYKNFYVPNNMRMSVIGNFDTAEMLKMIEEFYGREEPGQVLLPEFSDWSIGFDRQHLKTVQTGKVIQRFYQGEKPVVEFIFPINGTFGHIFFRLLDERLADKAVELNQRLGDLADRVEMQTLNSPVADFLEVKLTLSVARPDVEKLRQQVEHFVAQMDFYSSDEAIEARANKIKTGFLKNLEKPHMFGIYNAHLIAVLGFDQMLASFKKENIIKSARQLNQFKIESKPIVVLNLPLQESKQDTQKVKLVTKLFKGQDGTPTLIIRQNPASQLVAMHYLIKHKAMWQSKYGKKAAQILHDCFAQRLKSEQNLAISQKYGLSVTANDNPYIPMDDIYLHPDFGYLRIEALNDDLPGLIHFLNSQLKDFKPTVEEFQKAAVKFSRKGGMMSRRGDPAKKLFDQLLDEQVYETLPYSEGPEEIEYQALLEFASHYFQPANMIIAVVSSEKPEEVKKWFAEFKGMPLDQEPPPVTKKIKLHDRPVEIEKQGNGQRSYIFWGFVKTIDAQDAPALKVLSLLLGDKIVFQIREKQGMAYRMRAGINVHNDRALFYVSQGTVPENVDALLKQYPSFFKPQVAEEFNEEAVIKSVNMFLGRMMFRRLSSINQAYYLTHSYYFHQNINYDEDFLQALKQVTLKDVRLVAQKYLQVENPIKIIVR